MRRLIVVMLAMLTVCSPSFASAASGGTKDAPVPLKTSAKVGDSWEVTVTKVYTDPTKIDPKATWFLDWLKANPVPKGQEILALKVHLKNVGSKAAYISDLSLDLVNATDFKYPSCGNPPGAVQLFKQLDVNEAVDTVVCFTIKTKDAGAVLLRAEPAFSFDESSAVWFAVSKASAPKASPTATTTIASSSASAVDVNAPGCEGLAAYQKAMFKVGRSYLAALAKDGIPPDRDITTYSSDDWTALANDVGDYQRGLKSVTPPDWAAAWHETQIERTGLAQQMATAAAKGGLFAVVPFKASLDKLDAKTKTELAAAIQTCGAFKQFQHDWDALDGDINGTPVPTPTPEPGS